MDAFYLGVDGGATRSRVAVITPDGSVVCRARGDAASPVAVGKAEAVNNLVRLIATCIEQMPGGSAIQRATVASAGASTRSYADWVQGALSRSPVAARVRDGIQVTNDTFAALWAGHSRLPAIVLVSGTGSHCLGINERGEAARASGIDWLLSDEGSAYFIGAKALKAVVRAWDGRGEPTALTEAVLSALNAASLADIHDCIYTLQPMKQAVANLARLATKLAEDGDQVAYKIVEDAAQGLIELVQAVANRLGVRDAAFELITIGGVFDHSGLVRQLFGERLHALYPAATVTLASPDAAVGAAKLARDCPQYDIWACYE